jgi:hypothetical protein
MVVIMKGIQSAPAVRVGIQIKSQINDSEVAGMYQIH